MIYTFLKKLVIVSLAVFFKKIVVNGKENIPNKGPLIIVANHPNTFLDPLIIAAQLKQRVGFIANAGIFTNNILKKVFTYLHVIPIYRQKDIKPDEKPDNRKTFAKCIDYLNNKGTFIIFPEGNSYYELKLRKIKTGTARIALSYEEFNSFEGGVQILPVALDYSDSLQFRSMVAVNINPTFTITDLKEAYENDQFEAARLVTERIRKELSQHVTHIKEKDQEGFLLRAHRFYYTYQDTDANLYKNPKKSLQLRHDLSRAIKYIAKNDIDLYKRLEKNLQQYFNQLNEENLSPGFFKDEFLNKNEVKVYVGYLSEFFLLGPFYLFGLVFNYLPYILPSKIFNSFKTDIEYKTSVQMVAGIFTFPLFYFLNIWLFRTYITPQFWWVILFAVLVPICGYITMYYYTEMRRFMRLIRFYAFIKTKKKKHFLEMRNQINEDIAKARLLLD